MRTQAIEKCARLMATAIEQECHQAAKQYAAKFRILTDRETNSASVIRELMNQGE